MKQVTVVIPNWNGRQFLEGCLQSLSKQDTNDFDICVVDNASEDDSVTFIRENYPSVSVILNQDNLGFSGGVNIGIRAAKTPYILLLNNDVEVEPHFVQGLLQEIQKSARIFSVSARMVNYRNRTLLDDCGDTYNVFGFQAQRGVGRPITTKKYLKPSKVFSACAGAAIYRKSAFEEIGYFDENHFAYLEDIDIGYRALVYGYENRYTPEAVVYHIGSAASGGEKYSDFKVRLSSRNAYYVVYKNMPLFFRIVNAGPIWIGRQIKKNFFKKIGFEKAFLDGMKEGKETKKAQKKVPVSFKNTFRYFKIEGMMIRYTFSYLIEYLSRR